MIIVLILLGIFLGIVLAMVIGIVLGSAQKQARKMVEKGEVKNIGQAKRILKSLGSLPAQMRTKETDELHDKLGRLIEIASTTGKEPVGFKH